jgi:hypothetical protein
MGTGADEFRIGGSLDLDALDADRGTWEAATLTDAQVPNPGCRTRTSWTSSASR